MRICFDTAAMMAALAARNGAARTILEKVIRGQLQLVASPALLEEWRAHALHDTALTLLQQDKTRISLFMDQLQMLAIPVMPSRLWIPKAKDPADDLVLAAAASGGAEMIIALRLQALSPAAQAMKMMIYHPAGALVLCARNTVHI